MKSNRKEYCLGFAFTSIDDTPEVVLIKKEKPTFQKGKLNGVGGQVEEDETAIAAMAREFVEETGVITFQETWTHFATFLWEDCDIHCFCAHHQNFRSVRTMTPEQVLVLDIWGVEYYPRMANVDWLIAMALTKLRKPLDNPALLIENYPE